MLSLPSPAQNTIGPINFSSPVPIAFAGAGVTNGFCPGQNFQSNVAWFCTSARGLGAPRMTFLSFSNDLVGVGLQVYACTNFGTITNAGISGTNQLMLDLTGTGLVTNDIVVLRSFANDQYQRLFVTNAVGSVSNGCLQTWPSAGFATAVGDLVYKMTPLYTLPGVLALTNYNAYGFAIGREGYPLLIDLNYSNQATIKVVTGDYIPRSGL